MRCYAHADTQAYTRTKEAPDAAASPIRAGERDVRATRERSSRVAAFGGSKRLGFGFRYEPRCLE
jgi:hypothetical protein